MTAPDVTCVVLIGIPASGKSSFFRSRFVDTHVRINGDMLRTAHREALLLDACLRGKISFVVDKTNVTRDERVRFLSAARMHGFRTEGYFLQSRRAECVERNRARAEHERIPDEAVGGMAGRLELPSLDEGFDMLWFVRLDPASGFIVEHWK